jgi:hypothetical protein
MVRITQVRKTEVNNYEGPKCKIGNHGMLLDPNERQNEGEWKGGVIY